MEAINTIGRRKCSIARIYMTPGKGNITINGREFKAYFPVETLQIKVMQPLNLVNEPIKYDLNINVTGGGITGQAEAVRLAISRALCEISADNRSPLKKEGWLTRDPRMVERKKYGRRKARRRFQFSKR